MRYKELEMMEFNQNTIDDFYESTVDMINDLLNLVCVKFDDELKTRDRLTHAGVMECLGFAIRYVKQWVKGNDFQGEK